jgi:hypothetical protein
LLYDGVARHAHLSGRSTHPLLSGLDADELERAAAGLRRMVLARCHRGSGNLAHWFPATIATWLSAHPDDQRLDLLVAQFCGSAECKVWREVPGGCAGRSLEEAWYQFFLARGIGDPLQLEEELVGTLIRTLAVTPDATFEWPSRIRRAPAGCFAVTQRLVLHAALRGCYQRGPVTLPIGALLLGAPPAAVVERCQLAAKEVERLAQALVQMGLLEGGHAR